MAIERQWGVGVVITVASVLAGGEVAAQSTVRVSVDSAGVQGNGLSVGPSISADGRYVTFVSSSNHLVPGDTNGRTDVFVRDRTNGTTVRASVSSSGAEGTLDCSTASISGDGLHVAFATASPTLVPGDTNTSSDVFVHDVASAVTTRVSVDSSGAQANGASLWPCISADGRYVAFSSTASSLVAGDANGVEDVFVRDLQLGVTVRASVATNGAELVQPSSHPSISADGRFVAFQSGFFQDISVRDLVNGTTVLAANCSSGFPPGCEDPSISADGRFVAYATYGAHVIGDTNQSKDIFVRDMQASVTTRVNVDSVGTPANGGPGNPFNSLPAISADGRFAAFYSGATNLVPGDTNGVTDVFVRDLLQPDVVVTCLGDGSASACPCGNSGLAGHGCDNSQSTGGSRLTARGTRRLSEDTFELTAAGELPAVLSVFFQGTTSVAPVNYGDGLRCIGGSLKRLYVKNAVAGIAIAPAPTDLSVSARSAALGDVIAAGTTRWYQVFYRDPNPAFCPNPPGNTWNISSGIEAAWGF